SVVAAALEHPHVAAAIDVDRAGRAPGPAQFCPAMFRRVRRALVGRAGRARRPHARGYEHSDRRARDRGLSGRDAVFAMTPGRHGDPYRGRNGLLARNEWHEAHGQDSLVVYRTVWALLEHLQVLD